MPLSNIRIEQTARDRWVAEVEVGGTTARRRRVACATFDDVVSELIATYREFVPHDPESAPRVADQPLDTSLFPTIPKPVTTISAAKMRDEADAAALASMSLGTQAAVAERKRRQVRGYRG